MTSFEGRGEKNLCRSRTSPDSISQTAMGHMKTEGREAEKEQPPCCFLLMVRIPRKDSSTPKKIAET